MKRIGVGLSLVLFVLFGAGSAQAQYFGRNKVTYETFDFEVMKTEHFDLYFYPEEDEAARKVARMAERWYERLSKLLGHQLKGRQPLILYASAPDFWQTNAVRGGIGEGTGGVTEALRRRIVLPSAGPLAETDHVLGHELVHAFQFDISSRRRGSVLPVSLRLPLWFVEGMAEYLSLGPEHPQTALWMRDALRADESLPEVGDLDHPRYFPYRWGHAFWAFVGGRFGDGAIARLLETAGQSGDVGGAFEEVLAVDEKTLSKEWHAALREAYAPFLEARQPVSRYGRALLTEKNAGELNVAPALSPDGKRIVFLSERDLLSVDFFLADAETGEVIRKIYSNATDAHLDSLQFIQSAGDWSPAGDRFVFAAVEKGRGLLAILDPANGDIGHKVHLPELDQVFDPAWSPRGDSIVFSAQKGGLLDLFVYDLGGDSLQRLTSDAYGDLQPSWSPDGRRVVFATDRFSLDLDGLSYGSYALATLDVESGEIRALPGFATARHSDPRWSADGASVYFISDVNGAPNVWRLDLQEGGLYQVTDLVTGVTGITPLSPALSVAGSAPVMAMAVREDGKYRIYRVDERAILAGVRAAGGRALASLLPPFERKGDEVRAFRDDPETGLPTGQLASPQPYHPSLGLEYAGAPSVGVGIDRFGTSVVGSTVLSFSDMLGDHRLDTVLNVNGSFDEIGGQAIYFNLKRRWKWGAGLEHIPFFTGGGVFRQTGTVGGEPAVIDTVITQKQINQSVFGLAQYPFNRSFRFETTLAYRRIGVDNEVHTEAFSLLDGRFLGRSDEQNLPSPDPLNLGVASAALVYDTSIFGATSPVLGRRFRLEATPTVGTLGYTSLLADFRQYFMPLRPYTLAFRVLHYGRYGGASQDPRRPDLFLGYPELVRGYESGSFDRAECELDEQGRCAVIDRLLGSRLLVAKAELRFPLFGVFGARNLYGPVPIELALFADAGAAWSRGESPSLFGGDRGFVSSVGLAARLNAFGAFIVETAFVKPLDRPQKGWSWQFSFVPGF